MDDGNIRISLIGLPGSGKSSIARLLAQHFALELLDTDALVEIASGMRIREFFDRCGEEQFRQMESTVLASCLSRPESMVLATGGGVVLRSENRQLLRDKSLVFYLRSTPTELAHRLRNDNKRPLLQGVDALRKLRELAAQRDPLYRQTAHYVVEANRSTAWGLVNWICMQLELGGHLPSTIKLAG
ncbi:shikimate kinase [Inhella sp.]|uniref:shikimate kinase n=1 Tax=Inhella sp. TaxID=1921806 RepID=UPI0035AE8F1A